MSKTEYTNVAVKKYQSKIIKKKNKLYRQIMIPERRLDRFLSILNDLLKYKKINWCKCSLSGVAGDFLSIFFLTIENKFS